ncbi:glycine betaine ABC transporter substrate-binding protein [Brevibacterium album]|uniref:glycine betaine ABC transporter substrate-binding protein n=1 Tax=Brevibacterium album TaxID=417948 RepID=UPI001FDF5A8C|nr:glycine betaine ABC transporter substrate-binding protein [Brevibacterium album]
MPAALAATALLLSACGETEAGQQALSGGEVEVDEALYDCEPGQDSVDLSTLEPDEDRDVTVGVFNGWIDTLVSAHLAEHLLEEEYGYSVTVEAYDPAPGFTGAAAGDIDWIASSQLPSTHADYLAEYGDSLDVQGCWYGEATNTIAVTEDSPAQSLADLQEMSEEYDSTIVGIEPGAGHMRVTADSVMPAYGLDDWELTEASTPAMLAAVQQAADSGENIAVTMWHPHWAYESFPLRDLEDPEGAFGPAEKLFPLTNSEFAESHPFVAQVLTNMAMDEERTASLMHLMAAPDEYDNENPEEAVAEWIGQNPDFLEEWKAGELTG